MPAVVFAAPYTDRSARVVCDECGLDLHYDRTAQAQAVGGAHNRDRHAYPEQPLDLDLDTDQETA